MYVGYTDPRFATTEVDAFNKTRPVLLLFYVTTAVEVVAAFYSIPGEHSKI